MIRVVLDTNIVVSAMLRTAGLPYSVLSLGLARRLRMCGSEPVLAEYEEVLRRPRFGITDERIAEVMGGIRASSLLVQPTVAVTAARDPDDNIFLECAQTAEARYLITGNIADYPDTWAGTRVLTVRLFFELGVDFRPVKGI